MPKGFCNSYNLIAKMKTMSLPFGTKFRWHSVGCLWSIVLLLHLASCNFTQSGQRKKAIKEEQQRIIASCAEVRLGNSFEFHKTAKDFLASYYKTRKESELFFAWYAMEDSIYMAKSAKNCWDKRNKHFHAAKNILQKNRILHRLIVQNMRQVPQAQLSELYLNDYQKLFVRDIQ